MGGHITKNGYLGVRSAWWEQGWVRQNTFPKTAEGEENIRICGRKPGREDRGATE